MQSNIGAAQARVQIRSNPPPYPVPPPPYPGPVSNIQVSSDQLICFFLLFGKQSSNELQYSNLRSLCKKKMANIVEQQQKIDRIHLNRLPSTQKDRKTPVSTKLCDRSKCWNRSK